MLTKVRDVALTVAAVLFSVLAAGAIYFAVSAGSALGRQDPAPADVPAVTDLETAPTECIGEEPC